MSMRKQRLLQDLYNVTRTVSQPKITPVLRGICQMQGPIDEADCDLNTNMVPSQADKDYNSCSKNLKSGQRAESGTCNVCSAPCSSCLHINQQVMGSKIDECSRETCTEYASNVSVDDAAPNEKILKFETEQKSEIRNSDGGNSSNASENVYLEVNLRNSGLSTAFQDVALPKLDEPKGKRCPDDTMSRVPGTYDVKLSDFGVSNEVRIDLPSYTASDGTLTPPENGKILSHLTSSACEEMKCNVGDSQNNKSRQSKNSKESSEQMPVSICSPTDLSVQNSGLAEPTRENAVDATCLLNARDDSSHAPSGKSLSHDPNLKDTGEDLSSCFQRGLELPTENLNSLSMKEVVPIVVHSDMAVDAFQVTNKVVGSCLSTVAKGNSLESHVMDGSDDSDMVEHDVKVCDICGDTGREDLLAICSRCSDGAEHTYCMREMLDKVPEGDWLCEECKLDVAIKNQKQDKVSSAEGNEKNSGQANPENPNSSTKSEAKGSNTEGNKACKEPSGVKSSAKRHAEDAEVSSAAKKHVLDPNVGPTKTSESSGVVALSRDSSFKQLDREKMKPTQQSSSCTIAAPESADSPDSISRLQTPQGTFIKSNSFNSLNVKTKVKLVDDFVPQKQRSVREPISLNKKEGASRTIGKSTSFKYTNPIRLNSSESKVKMLSSKFPPIQDIKGLKHTKDWSLFDRKNSFNAESTPVSSPMATSSSFTAKKDKKLASWGEASLLTSVRNHRDSKPVQSDNKSMTLSRSSSFAVRRGSELPVSLGEVKRLSSQLASVVGVPSTNGTSSCDMKPKPSSPKEDSSSSSCIAERPPCYANEGLPDGLPRLKESVSFCERAKESSVRSKQSSASGRTVVCQNCNEFGHLAQFCTADRPASPASDVSAAKSSREIMEGKDKLKAAIEAAVLRKPGIYRKHRVLDQSDDVSVSSISSEIAPQDRLSNSSNKGNASAAEEMPEGQMLRENSSADSCKQASVDNVKQSGMHNVDALTSRTGDACHGITTEGSSLIRDVSGQIPAAISILPKTLAIPDYEYIWQGNFEIYRNGKTLKFCNGIQAHLSSCASPKVLQVLNKFPHKVLLNEVPRLSTWPRQFQEYGVKEDNIALFFFAKDLLSYEKSYKMLLDNMMKNDLTLKGNVDDVELLIFPSNQLPEKSQRWNTLFFLWGLFRGRRAGCSEHVLSSQNQIHFAQETPTAIMSSPENICILRPLDKDLSECGESGSASEVLASREFPCLSSSQTLDRDFNTRVSAQVLPGSHMQIIMEKQDHRVDSSSFLVVESSNPKSCEKIDTSISRGEMQPTSTSLEGGVEPQRKLEQGVHASGEATTKIVGFDKCEQRPKDEDSSLSGQHSLHQLDGSKADGLGSLREGNVLHKMSTTRCQVDLEDGSMLDSPPSGTIDQTVKDNRKHQHVETVERTAKAASARTSEVIPDNGADDRSVEEVHTSKRRKADFCGSYGGSDQASSPIEGYMSGIHNLASCSPIRVDCGDEGFDGTDAHTFGGNAEMYFFPVGPRAEEIDINKAAPSIPWKLNPLEDDRLHDIVPNLELALGAETKSLTQGFPTFLVGKEEKKIIQDHCSNEGTSKGEDDDESASLSLSLSFPFPDEEQRVRSISDTQRQNVNTSLLLFGGLRDK